MPQIYEKTDEITHGFTILYSFYFTISSKLLKFIIISTFRIHENLSFFFSTKSVNNFITVKCNVSVL